MHVSMEEPALPLSKIRNEKITKMVKKFFSDKDQMMKKEDEMSEMSDEMIKESITKQIKELKINGDFIHDSRILHCIKSEVLNDNEPSLRNYVNRSFWLIEFLEIIQESGWPFERGEFKKLKKDFYEAFRFRLNFDKLIYSETIFELWRPKVMSLLATPNVKQLKRELGEKHDEKFYLILSKLFQIERKSDQEEKKLLQEAFRNNIFESKHISKLTKLLESFSNDLGSEEDRLVEFFKNMEITEREKKDLDEKSEEIRKIIMNNVSFSSTGIKEVKFASMGSHKNGFATRSSDLDVTILTNCFVNERKLLRHIEERIKGSLEKLLPLHHEKIRVPLLRVETVPHVDILINNVLGVLNSRLLLTYSMLDERVRQMVVILKEWGKRNKFIDEKYIPSYGLTLMVIYFLQLKRILPSLQKISKEQLQKSGRQPTMLRIKRISADKEVHDFETRADFETDKHKIFEYMEKNNYKTQKREKLGALLSDFFKFYQFKDGLFHKSKMRCNIKKGDIDFKKPAEANLVFSIKDPFDKKHNPGFKTYVDKDNHKCLKEAEMQLKERTFVRNLTK